MDTPADKACLGPRQPQAVTGGEGMSSTLQNHSAVSMADSPEGIACIRLTGDIDMTADDALHGAVARIVSAPRSAVYVDLAAVGFAGSTLVNFLARLIDTMPMDRPVLLCRPSHSTRRLIELCALDTVATISNELPADFTAAPPTATVT
jgi:anti-anti-sigma factor